MRTALLVLASSLAWGAYCADAPEKQPKKKAEPHLKSPPAPRAEPGRHHAPRKTEPAEKKPERASLSPKNRVGASGTTVDKVPEPFRTKSTERGSSPKRQAERDQPASAPLSARNSAPAAVTAPPATAQDALRGARERRLSIERDEAKLTPGNPARPAPRLPVAAEPTTQMTCRALPACPEPNHICFPVEHTYGGGQNVFAAARQDTLRACRRSNAGDPCCAQQCDSAVQCTAR